MMKTRSYSELCEFTTFEDRYNYLKLSGVVGEKTFGRDRWLNQVFYNRMQWRKLRDKIIARDLGCDLGILGHEFGPRQIVIIHHMNPIQLESLKGDLEACLDPEYLIACSLDTHNAIHFGKELSSHGLVERFPNDTTPWKK